MECMWKLEGLTVRLQDILTSYYQIERLKETKVLSSDIGSIPT